MIPTVLLGAGKSGSRLAAALDAHPSVDLRAIVGGSAGSAAALGRRLGVAAFREADDGWELPRDGLLVVATPHHRHVPQVLAGLCVGADVLVEKPVAPDRAGFDRIAAASTAAGRRVSCAMVQRCGPELTECRDFLRAEGDRILGMAVSQLLRREPGYYAGWKGDPAAAGGGVLLNQAIHALDLALYLTDAVPLSARAVLGRTRPIAVEDFAHATVETSRGLLSMTATTCAGVEEAQVIRVFLPGETVVIVGSETPRWRRVASSSVQAAIAELAADPVPFGPGHVAWVRDAVQARLAGVPSRYECDLARVRAGHEVVYALYDSARQQGAPVPVAAGPPVGAKPPVAAHRPVGAGPSVEANRPVERPVPPEDAR